MQKIVDIVLDGGNVIKSKNKVILTTKIFKENSTISEETLIVQLKNYLGVNQIIIIPQEPKDHIGHADSIVRYIDGNTFLLNQYPKDKLYEDFRYALKASLSNADLSYIEFPYNSWKNDDPYDATGCYINFLEIGNYIFLRQFNDPEDIIAFAKMKDVFISREVIGVDCGNMAKLGGVLNCATWNIFKY
jgi:agmatine deiminase